MTAIDIIQWLGETSLAVSLLILVVLILRKPFTKAFGARAAYALWLAPAARLFLPELKILPAPVETESTVLAPAMVHFEPAAPAAEFLAATPSYDFASLGAATALVIWAMVAFAWFNIKLESQSRFMRAMMAASKPAPSPILSRAEKLARQFGLKRAPIVRICDDETGPCVVGLFRPVIFLPATFESHFSERERHLALAHEICHVARGDMAATLAAIGLQSVQWPNPLAHFAFQKFRTDQEAACDAFVLARCMTGAGAASAYAAAIMKSVRAGTGAPAYGLSLAHPVKERLMLLKNQKKSPIRMIAGAVSAIAIATAGLGATASYGYAPDQDEDEAETTVKRRVSLKSTIEADPGETMEIEGVRDPARIEYENENGKRTVKIYNKRGRLISDNVYEKGEDLPFKEVVIRTKDGEVRKIQLDGPFNLVHPVPPVAPLELGFVGLESDNDHEFAFDIVVNGDNEFITLGEDGKNIVRQFAFVEDGSTDFVKRSAVVKADGVHAFAYGDMSGCMHSEDGEKPMVFAWSTTDNDDMSASEHEVICLTDANADPETRAEMLREAIEHMEENAQREAERRKKMISKMRKELKELERQK